MLISFKNQENPLGNFLWIRLPLRYEKIAFAYGALPLFFL